MQKILEIKNLFVDADDTHILNGVNLSVNKGEIAAIMGPNGSGKSTLALSLMGSPSLNIKSGTILFDNEDMSNLEVHERSLKGLFLAFQHPIEIPGVNVGSFLYAAYKAKFKKEISIFTFIRDLKNIAKEFGIKDSFLNRNLNVGFSGGEKKRIELLQIAVLKPKLAILDEVDSGVDIDSLSLLSSGINKLKKEGMSFLVITHHIRILQKINVDSVHIMHSGKIVRSGDISLAEILENGGYKSVI